MKVKVNKKSATIKFTKEHEVEAFRELLKQYMPTSYDERGPDAYPMDNMAFTLSEEFKKKD